LPPQVDPVTLSVSTDANQVDPEDANPG
jgi:hypothetical protein